MSSQLLISYYLSELSTHRMRPVVRTDTECHTGRQRSWRGFEDFSFSLYCSGTSCQRCPSTGGADLHPGQCYWRKREDRRQGSFSTSTLTEADMNITSANKKRFAWDRWDPAHFGAPFRHFHRQAARECTGGKWLHVAGDSTARDTFYALMLAAGKPIYRGYRNKSTRYWQDSRWTPLAPYLQGGTDLHGVCSAVCTGDCMHVASDRQPCLRDEQLHEAAGLSTTRISFNFMKDLNVAAHVEHTRKLARSGARSPDAVIVQCPYWTLIWPHAYDASVGLRQKRHMANWSAPGYFDDVGLSCRNFVNAAFPQSRVFILGTPPIHDSVAGAQRLVMQSVRQAFGVMCPGHEGRDRLHALNTQQVVPIDTYNIVGPRKRGDGIHPHFNAQFDGITQMILNHLCPSSPSNGTIAP